MNMSISSSFDGIVRDTFYQLLEIHPEQAINIGLPFEGKLPDLSEDAIMRERGLIYITLEKLRDVDIDTLSFSKKLDFLAFRDYLKLRGFFIDKWPVWKMYPEAPEILYNILLHVYLNPEETLENKVKMIANYLRDTPGFLEKSKTRVKQPVRIFVDVSILMLTSIKHFLYIMFDEISKDSKASKVYSNYKREIENGLEALDHYIEWLQSLREREIYEYVMGKELYNDLIRIRKLYASVDDAYRLLKKMIEDGRKRLEALAAEVKAGASPKDILEMIYEKSPSNPLAAISLYERAITDVRRILIEKKLISLRDVPVDIVPLPAPASLFLPYFYYYPTVVSEKGIEKATIFVKISDDPDELKQHNAYYVLHRVMREVFPGKHLMYIFNLSSNNMVRMMLDLPELYEGWALYSDHVMAEAGYTDTPIDNFIRALDIYRSILIAYIDIAVNIGDMKHTDASKFLMEKGYMTQNEATSSVIQVLLSPSSGLSAYLGYRYLLDIRRRMESLAGKELDEKWFHNEILKNAVLPLPYLEASLLRGYSDYLLDKLYEIASKED